MADTLHITDVQLFNVLKKKLGEMEAETLVSYVRSSVKEEIKEQIPNIATKDFVEAEISKSEARLEAKISEAKFQIILWAFVFWVTQLSAIFAFLKFLM